MPYRLALLYALALVWILIVPFRWLDCKILKTAINRLPVINLAQRSRKYLKSVARTSLEIISRIKCSDTVEWSPVLTELESRETFRRRTPSLLSVTISERPSITQVFIIPSFSSCLPLELTKSYWFLWSTACDNFGLDSIRSHSSHLLCCGQKCIKYSYYALRLG